MTARKLVFAGPLAAALLVLAAAALFPARRSQVLRTFARVGRLASKTEGESPLSGAVRARELAGLLADDVLVRLPDSPDARSVSREEAQALMLRGRAEVRYLEVRFDSVRVSFRGRDTALAAGDLSLASGPGPLDVSEDVPEFEAVLVREPGSRRWRFSEIALRRVIEK